MKWAPIICGLRKWSRGIWKVDRRYFCCLGRHLSKIQLNVLHLCIWLCFVIHTVSQGCCRLLCNAWPNWPISAVAPETTEPCTALSYVHNHVMLVTAPLVYKPASVTQSVFANFHPTMPCICIRHHSSDVYLGMSPIQNCSPTNVLPCVSKTAETVAKRNS